MGFHQDEKLIKMISALGGDNVFVTSFSGQETISRLFSYHVDFLCLNLELTAEDIVGKVVTIELEIRDEKGTVKAPRVFSGRVNRMRAGYLGSNSDLEYRAYSIEIVPDFWFLTQASDCKLWVDTKIKDIFDQRLEPLPFRLDVTSKAFDTPLEQCVQYRETDFNFISRLAEQHGVYYYFEHKESETKVVFSDKKNYPSCQGDSVIFPGNTSSITDNCINSWEHAYEIVPKGWVHTDYNFKHPLSSLKSNTPTLHTDPPCPIGRSEMFDFPGEYAAKPNGTELSKGHQEELEVAVDVVDASSTCKTFNAGYTFKLDNRADSPIGASEEGEYLITSISHSASQPFMGAGDEAHYSNSFSCIPSDTAFRPARTTPKPVISGVQTAVVTGPAGEEIYTDEFGRVKVFFHWDRERRTKEGHSFPAESSMWVRCAQNVAGRKWGFMAIPRVGQEVVVEFLEGDPDRPLITGGVYNTDQPPHYDPRDHKTRTYIKTNSTKGGEGFNELMFDDLHDKELVFVHAQKNMDVRVLNDSTEIILGSRHQVIGTDNGEKKTGDQSETVMNDKHLNIKKDQHEKIEGNYFLAVGHGDADSPGKFHLAVETAYYRQVGVEGVHCINEGDEKRAVAQNYSLDVSNDRKEKVGGTFGLKTTGDFDVASANISSDAQQNINNKAGMDYAVEGGMNVHIKGGLNVVIEAGIQLTLKVGGSFVAIGPAGVDISGPMVKINSGGAAGGGGGCSPNAPSSTDFPDDTEQPALLETLIAHNESTGQKSTA